MRIGRLICLSLMLAAGCAKSPPLNKGQFELNLPGPTLAQRVGAGYELKNRHVRVVIDDNSGDVIYWGSTDGTKNLLEGKPARFLVGDEKSISNGYVKARDDQTWQYLGEDAAHHLSWRKIYCLDGDHLNISVLFQNKTETAVDATMGLEAGNFPDVAVWKGAEQFDGGNSVGFVHLHGYNEFHDKPAKQPRLLLSDPHHLQPGERISWTMQWTCDLNK